MSANQELTRTNLLNANCERTLVFAFIYEIVYIEKISGNKINVRVVGNKVQEKNYQPQHEKLVQINFRKTGRI